MITFKISQIIEYKSLAKTELDCFCIFCLTFWLMLKHISRVLKEPLTKEKYLCLNIKNQIIFLNYFQYLFRAIKLAYLIAKLLFDVRDRFQITE